MNKIVLISETFHRAYNYMSLNYPERNPRGPGVYIITGDHDVQRMRGLTLDLKDKVVIESYPLKHSPALFQFLKMLRRDNMGL